MTKFDEYVEEIERRHIAQRQERLNKELARRFHGRTHDEALRALFACMSFPLGVSDVLMSSEPICEPMYKATGIVTPSIVKETCEETRAELVH